MFFFLVAQILEPQRLVFHLLLPHQAGLIMNWMFLIVLLFLRETHQFSRISKLLWKRAPTIYNNILTLTIQPVGDIQPSLCVWEMESDLWTLGRFCVLFQQEMNHRDNTTENCFPAEHYSLLQTCIAVLSALVLLFLLQVLWDHLKFKFLGVLHLLWVYRSL